VRERVLERFNTRLTKLIQAIAKSLAYAGAKGIVIAARTEKDLDRTAELIKRINPQTQVLKVVTDVADRGSVDNLFKEAFNRFNEVDVS